MFHRERKQDDFNTEVESHIALEADRLKEQGLSEEEAQAAARRAFGNLTQAQERFYESNRWRWVDELRQDVSYGLRQLRRNPGFTAVAVITLALGIGANTAIFSVIDAALLRPLPYKNPSRLVWATERFPFNHGAANVISPDFMGWQSHNRVFEQIGASGGAGGANLTGTGQAVRVSIANVTTNFFPMLGIRPLMGRTFLASEGKLDDDHVALVSESLWRNHFGADPHILGKSIRLDGSAYTVVGVMQSNLQFPDADVWTPFALNEERFSPHSPRWAILTVVARLKPGIGIPQAQSDLQVITDQMDKEYPPQAAQFRSGERVEVIPLHELLVRNVRPLLLIFMGAVGFVLLIACLNVANVLLSRGVARAKEMGVRAALGAGRWRLIRQLLTEALLLAISGGLLGLLLGFWTTQIVAQVIPPHFPSAVRLDARVFAFTAFIALGAVLVFGLAPALIASRTDVGEALKSGGMRAGTNRATHRLRGLLSAVEIALSLVLLAGAGLLVRSFLGLTDVKLGFDPHGLLAATVQRTWSPNPDASKAYAAYFQNVLARVQHLPGVKDAAVTSQYPFGPPHNGTTLLNVLGRGKIRPPQVVMITSISHHYFRVMQMRLLKGRVFTEQDTAGAQPVAIVNESLARILFDKRDPLGQHISFVTSPKSWTEVVGVVSDTRNGSLEDDPGPELFVPYFQQPSFIMTFMLRAANHPDSLAGPLRKAVQEVDKSQPLYDVDTMDAVIANQLAPRRFKMLLLGLFALLALALATVGVYGVVAYSSSQRTHEFAIRMALGAERRDVLNMVLGQGIRLAFVGVAIGAVGAFALTRFLSSLLYGVGPTDPATFISVSLILIAVALAACYIPARRAAKVDPMVALRYE